MKVVMKGKFNPGNIVLGVILVIVGERARRLGLDTWSLPRSVEECRYRRFCKVVTTAHDRALRPRDFGGVTSALSASWVEIRYLMEEGMGRWKEEGANECNLWGDGGEMGHRNSHSLYESQ
ncbi:hypothetical protein EVAR_24734_1 [Eumeta japonica]|uniref:Uncharacterized protein n=1 Tax=Eumeta variegata TaxID=151549 RepID=A0A4C1VD03_EUMVA|nr:hypothetical protein EVAR_24734_1 [Eumeta japonica]